MKVRFDSLINVSLLLVCLLVGTNTALQMRDRFQGMPAEEAPASPTSAPSPPQAPQLQRGAVLPSIQGISYGDAQQTMVMVHSSRCTYCTRSMPFYRKFIEQRNGGSKRVRFVAVGREPVDAMKEYLASNGVTVDQVVSLTSNDLQIQGTPTLIVADGEGRVQQTFVGKLPAQAEAEVLSMLQAGAITSRLEKIPTPIVGNAGGKQAGDVLVSEIHDQPRRAE
mgnify:CR=1 FL=1